MTLAIAYHDTPESPKDSVIFPTNPSRPKADEIPATLYAKMMVIIISISYRIIFAYFIVQS